MQHVQLGTERGPAAAGVASVVRWCARHRSQFHLPEADVSCASAPNALQGMPGEYARPKAQHACPRHLNYHKYERQGRNARRKALKSYEFGDKLHEHLVRKGRCEHHF